MKKIKEIAYQSPVGGDVIGIGIGDLVGDSVVNEIRWDFFQSADVFAYLDDGSVSQVINPLVTCVNYTQEDNS